MLRFAQDLLEQGRVVVPLMRDALVDESAALEKQIQQLDAARRLELAFTAPALSIPAALWALGFLENACRFLVYRELDESVMSAAFAKDCPVPASPSCSYSADLFLRYLPDVTRMARGIGQDDPLVLRLQQTAARWPLSSVGMAGIVCEVEHLKPVLSHRCLARLYVDRIIERGDVDRLKEPAVREAVQAALGAHPALSPVMSGAISRTIAKFEEQP